MTPTESEHLKALKDALLTLSPAGEHGFEGLIGTALSALTGIPLRLAGSGLQFGLDGKSAYAHDSICFEGKRYDQAIPRNEVITKVAELPRFNPDIDLWILGASVPVSAQRADDLRAMAARGGLAVEILDWGRSGLPALAVALAMAENQIASFLTVEISNPALLRKALAALAAMRTFDGFDAHAGRIRKALSAPAIGMGLARRANSVRLHECFANKRKAKRFLGQPIAPAENGAGTKTRVQLASVIGGFFAGKPEGEILAVLGGEGNGKSWAVAQS